MQDVTVVVPAYNEAGRVGSVVEELVADYDVLVVDDGSTDGTVAEARDAGARVVEQPTNQGYIAALKRGFREADTEIVVTYDADGEHRPADVARVAEPIDTHDLGLVLGARSHIPRPSERLLNHLTRLKVPVSDSGTGLRALRRDLAVELELDTVCTCGTLVLEATAKGARIGEVPIETREIAKPRGIAWGHGRQLLHVLRYLRKA
ncbi:MAG: glycosyltransferase family 2 protein [Halapricum sp.]